jgi:DNA-binding LacI/PurR family transcriptional regulator
VILLGSSIAPGTLSEVATTVPLVLIGTSVPGIDAVVNDDERGSELVVEHLVGLGHTRVVHVDGGVGAGAAGRRRGFLSAMQARGLAPLLIEGDSTDEAGARAAAELLSWRDPPSALFCASDLSAVAASDRLAEAGLQVPRDISIVGHDNTSLARLSHVGLTTVSQPCRQMGRVAVGCALERLDGGRRVAVRHVLEPELVVRSTSGPPPTPRTGQTR